MAWHTGEHRVLWQLGGGGLSAVASISLGVIGGEAEHGAKAV